MLDLPQVGLPKKTLNAAHISARHELSVQKPAARYSLVVVGRFPPAVLDAEQQQAQEETLHKFTKLHFYWKHLSCF